MLHAYRWSETSKIVHLFSAELGSIKVIARGALRPKSPFRGALEALNHIEVLISLKETRGLQIITSAYLQNAYLKIRDSLEKTAVAFSILEALRYYFHSQESATALFRYVVEVLELLDDHENGNEAVFLWHFLFRFSRELGFGWNLDTCLVCQSTPSDFPVLLVAESGGILCPRCATGVPGEKLTLDRNLWSALCGLNRMSLEQALKQPLEISPALKMQVSDQLVRHLNFHTERDFELKSLKWYGG